MDIKILVATHKEHWMPQDSMYYPIQVGAAINSFDLGINKDNSGDNISKKNKNYCELTGIYWAWKNLGADYIGSTHYRRYFANSGLIINKSKKSISKHIINKDEVEKLLKNNDILLPNPRCYFFIETNYSQYKHAHRIIDLDTTREVVKDLYPEYIENFDKVMKSTICHRFNMFIMKKDKFDEYCKFLFNILFELENRLDISDYNDDDGRVFGYMSEMLLDTWINTKGYSYKNIPYVVTENQNWINKGYNFIKRKLTYSK